MRMRCAAILAAIAAVAAICAKPNTGAAQAILYPTLPSLQGTEAIELAYAPGNTLGPFYTTPNQLAQYIGSAGVIVPGALGSIQTSDGNSHLGVPIVPATGIAAWLAAPSSLNLLAALTSKTGTGNAVFGTGPTVTALTLGDIIGSTQCLHVNTVGLVTGSGSDCGGTGGTPAGSNGDIQINNTGAFGALTPAAGIATWLAAPSSLNLLAALTSKTGTGNAVFGTAPTLTTPTIAALANLTSNGLMKTSGGVGTLGIATAGTDYAAAPTGGANTPLFNAGGGGFTNGTRSGNTTRLVSMDASTPATNDCAKFDANNNLTTSGGACGGTGTPGGSNGQFQWNNFGAFAGGTIGNGLDLTAGALTLNSVTNDQTAGNYIVLGGDNSKTVLVGTHTYTLAQAGTGLFTNKWSACFLNTGGGDATLTTTTSTFNGAGGATSLTLHPGSWACPTSDGTNYPTVWGTHDGGDLTTATVTSAKLASKSGNGTIVATTTGAQTSGKCVTIDVNGNHVADTGACGGAGATPAGSTGDIQYNNAAVFGARSPSGNGTTVVTTTGAQTSGKCVTIDANGNHVADASACGGAASGLTLISTQTANNTATNLLWTGLSGSDYQLRCNTTLATNAQDFLVQFSSDGGGTWGSATGYEFANTALNTSNGSSTGTQTATSGFNIRSSAALSNTTPQSFRMDFFSLNSSTVNKRMVGSAFIKSSTPALVTMVLGGDYYGDTNAITALRVVTTSGNIASGACSLYLYAA